MMKSRCDNNVLHKSMMNAQNKAKKAKKTSSICVKGKIYKGMNNEFSAKTQLVIAPKHMCVVC